LGEEVELEVSLNAHGVANAKWVVELTSERKVTVPLCRISVPMVI
jgi:hypothetical protein